MYLRFLFLLSVLLPACATVYQGSETLATFDFVITNSVYCYSTRQGVRFYRAPGVTMCPPFKLVEQELSNLLIRINAPRHVLRGQRVVFTHDVLLCNEDDETIGCSTPGLTAVRLNDDDWRLTLSHEIGHQLDSLIERFDPEHSDILWWRIVEKVDIDFNLVPIGDSRTRAFRNLSAEPLSFPDRVVIGDQK